MFCIYKYILSSTAIGDWVSCSAANNPAKCTKCDSVKKRILVGVGEGYCKCELGWFDDGVHELCLECHYSWFKF